MKKIYIVLLISILNGSKNCFPVVSSFIEINVQKDIEEIIKKKSKSSKSLNINEIEHIQLLVNKKPLSKFSYQRESHNLLPIAAYNRGAESCIEQLVTILLSKKANVNSLYRERTALSYLVDIYLDDTKRKDILNTIKLLLVNGACCKCKDGDGQTPQWVAKERKSRMLFSLFQSFDQAMQAIASNSDNLVNALQKVLEKNTEIFELLVKYSINQKNYDALNALIESALSLQISLDYLDLSTIGIHLVKEGEFISLVKLVKILNAYKISSSRLGFAHYIIEFLLQRFNQTLVYENSCSHCMNSNVLSDNSNVCLGEKVYKFALENKYERLADLAWINTLKDKYIKHSEPLEDADRLEIIAKSAVYVREGNIFALTTLLRIAKHYSFLDYIKVPQELSRFLLLFNKGLVGQLDNSKAILLNEPNDSLEYQAYNVAQENRYKKIGCFMRKWSYCYSLLAPQTCFSQDLMNNILSY